MSDQISVRDLEGREQRVPTDFWVSVLSTVSRESNRFPKLGDSAVARLPNKVGGNSCGLTKIAVERAQCRQSG